MRRFDGAKIASDVAARDYWETVFVAPQSGSRKSVDLWLRMLEKKYFHVETLDDIVGQQMFGTLKNVIAIAGGFVDGLEDGQSSKAAVFGKRFY
jgi:glycerol-3-phosphate dehydrogenase (NAD+)